MSASGERKTRQQRLPAPQRQRGAVAVFVAAGLVALIASLLLVLDIGRLYYTQRQLQLNANMAALAGAQAGSGCLSNSDGVPGDSAAIQAAVLQSLKNNTPGLGAPNTNQNSIAYLGDPTAYETNKTDKTQTTGLAGSAFLATDLVNPGDKVLKYAIQVGRAVLSSNRLTNTFKPLDIDDPSRDSVRVTLATQAPSSFLSALFPGNNGTKTLYASATAKQQALGSFYLGTGLLSLKGGLVNEILGGLLCPTGDTACQSKVLALDIASFNGLADVGVSLGQLAVAAGLQVKDLTDPAEIQTKTPILSDVLNSLAGQLAGNVADPTVITTLQSLATAVQGSNQTIPLGLILKPLGTAAANVPFINLKDLIIGLGESTHIDPDHPDQVRPIELPIKFSLPAGTLSTGVFLTLGQHPVFSGLVPAGSSEALKKTSEIKLRIRLSVGQLATGLLNGITGALNDVLGLIGDLTGISLSVDIWPDPINLGVDVGVASAAARLDSLQCPSTDHGPIAQLSAKPAIASVAIGSFEGDATDNPDLVPDKTNFKLLTINLKATLLHVIPLGEAHLSVGLKYSTVGVGDTDDGALTPLKNLVTDFKACGPVDSDPSCEQGGTGPGSFFLADGVPPASPVTDNPQTKGSLVSVGLNLALTHSNDDPKGLIGAVAGLLDDLVDAVQESVQPLLDLVNTLGQEIIDPLLNLLGIQLGQATITMNTAVFGQPVIVTNCLPLGGDPGANGNGCPAPKP